MAGFGKSPFGSMIFGHVDVLRELFWSKRTIPEQMRLDDAEHADGQLEKTLMAIADTLRPTLNAIRLLPDIWDPLKSTSALESEISLAMTSAEVPGEGRVRVTIDPADRDQIADIFPRSTRSNGEHRKDGWRARIGRGLFPVVDTDLDAGWVEIETNLIPTSPVAFRPPDLLELLGEQFAITVDERDPPDFSRRALYRYRLIRDLKVSERLFSFLGKVYGFDVSVTGLFAIDAQRATNFTARGDSVWEYPPASGCYYTDIAPYGHRFDQIAADVIETDTTSDVAFPTTLHATSEPTPNYWSVAVDQAEADLILGVGSWTLTDAAGTEFWIEGVGPDYDIVTVPVRDVYVYAASQPQIGAGFVTAKAEYIGDCNYYAASAYRAVIVPDEVLTEPGAVLEDLVERILDKIGVYIPLHIKFVLPVFRRSLALVDADFTFPISTHFYLNGHTSPDAIAGTRFDDIPADVQNADDGAFIVTTSFTVT